jgi:hypothetical protein
VTGAVPGACAHTEWRVESGEWRAMLTNNNIKIFQPTLPTTRRLLFFFFIQFVFESFDRRDQHRNYLV